MSDLIERQAAIDALAEKLYHNVDDYRTAVFVIGNLPSVQPEQRWIPCSERLPEEYGEYQITWTTSYASKKLFIGDAEYEITGEWDSENDRFKGEWLLHDYMEYYQNVKVIAWMPLPEPYKGERREDADIPKSSL